MRRNQTPTAGTCTSWTLLFAGTVLVSCVDGKVTELAPLPIDAKDGK